MYIFQYYIACNENYSNICERDIFPIKKGRKTFISNLSKKNFFKNKSNCRL